MDRIAVIGVVFLSWESADASLTDLPDLTLQFMHFLYYFYILRKQKFYYIINIRAIITIHIVKDKYQNKCVIQTSSNNLLRKGVNVILFHENPGE